MMHKLRPLWLQWRWKLALVFVPSAILLLGALWLWAPMRTANMAIDLESENLQALMSTQGAFAARMDTLKQQQKQLQDLLSAVQSFKMPAVAGMDSLRKVAESSDLRVLDMANMDAIPSGASSAFRMDLEGDYGDIMAWMDSLEFWHPMLQVYQVQWSAGLPGDLHRIQVQIQVLDLNKALSDSATVQTWLARSKYWFALRASSQVTGLLKNPFAGRHAVRVVVKAAPKAAPMAPAPQMKIVGLVAGRMATVMIGVTSEKRLLRVGDTVGDWSVEAISANTVTLRNQGETKVYRAQ